MDETTSTAAYADWLLEVAEKVADTDATTFTDGRVRCAVGDLRVVLDDAMRHGRVVTGEVPAIAEEE